MINIQEKNECCGCAACVQSCPKQCIGLQEDDEGFLYPQVDTTICITCGLCDKVCPVINQKTLSQISNAFAAVHRNDEIRKESSSGGVFTSLAEQIIGCGGVVFGAKYAKDGSVIHACIDSINDINKLRGSKYLQSVIGSVYIQTKRYLDKGQLVLFSGTPCQIAGLKLFLRKEYENLYTVDIVCHGVPSPKVWKDYITYLKQQKAIDFSDSFVIPNFRDKENGWRQYMLDISLVDYKGEKSILHREFAKDNIYMEGFLKNLYIRPSCFSCPAKGGRSNSDLTLGDFWGVECIQPDMDDNLGTSIVVVHTDKALQLIDSLNIVYKKIDSSDLFRKKNVCYYRSTTKLKNQEEFWSLYKEKGINAIPIFLETIKPSLVEIGLLRIKQMIRKLLK